MLQKQGKNKLMKSTFTQFYYFTSGNIRVMLTRITFTALFATSFFSFLTFPSLQYVISVSGLSCFTGILSMISMPILLTIQIDNIYLEWIETCVLLFMDLLSLLILPCLCYLRNTRWTMEMTCRPHNYVF